QSAEQIDLLLGLGFRDHNDGAVPFGLSYNGQADPGVSGCALDNGCAGFENAAFLSVLDDPQRSAILHRSARVHELCFAQDFASSDFGKVSQAQKRRATDVAIYSTITRWIHANDNGRAATVWPQIFLLSAASEPTLSWTPRVSSVEGYNAGKASLSA